MSDSDLKKRWHTTSLVEAFDTLNTSKNGLSLEEIKKRLSIYGPNTLQSRRQEKMLSIVFRQLKNPLVYILLGSTVLALILGKFTDAIVVFSVVLINTIIGFIQEYQAGQTIQGLLKMVPEWATVIRDEDQKKIPASELVPGDYILLQSGDRVSADVRLTEVKGFQCNESALTGESAPVFKTIEPNNEDASIGDRTCMALSGTLVTAGTAEGLVVTTGSQTEIGKISNLLETTTSSKTPLTKSLEVIARSITISILSVSTIVLVIGVFRDYSFVDALFSAITLAVATIPEGLPAIITIASAIGVSRMGKRNVIIRHLPAVETLGSTTTICSDKTGTLTRNEMTVQVLWNGRKQFEITENGIISHSKIAGPHPDFNADLAQVEELLIAGVLCNDSTIETDASDSLNAVGDPTEIALVVASEKVGLPTNELRKKWERLDELPFDSDRKMMATLHKTPDNKKTIFLKGAPENVINVLANGSDDRNSVLTEAIHMAHKGFRVLAFGVKELPDSHSTLLEENDLISNFKFLGLQGMIDPPRTEVLEAIQGCHRAGITVKMITGDHPGTATAIGKALNIMTDDQTVYTGFDLDKLSEAEFGRAAVNCNIFARVAPEHKLKLVKALQARDHIVAMTGDGVNDAPALKKADIGVAMGISGTAVAKETADMILVDDNFKSIEAAVEEGRRVYDNLIKSVAFLLPTSIGLGLVIFIGVLFFPIRDGVLLRPMLPVQVLWINLITAVALALPLSLEVMEPDIMRRKPRKPNTPILSRFLIFRIILVSLIMAGGTIGLFLWEYDIELSRGTSPELAESEAQTMAVTTMVLFQAFYLLNCRSLKYPITKIGLFSNRTVFLGIAFVILAQLAFVYLPFMQQWFDSSALKADAWGISIAIAFTILPIIGFEKWIRLRIKG